jgi:hypothetical protein
MLCKGCIPASQGRGDGMKSKALQRVLKICTAGNFSKRQIQLTLDYPCNGGGKVMDNPKTKVKKKAVKTWYKMDFM